MSEKCTKLSKEELRHVREIEGESPYIVWTDIYATGDDIQVIVGGGDRPHVGAIALAEPGTTTHPVTGETIKNVEEDSCKITAISGQGHKEKEVAIAFAKAFCVAFEVNVAASVGIHIDDATKEEIVIFTENINRLISKSIDTWRT